MVKNNISTFSVLNKLHEQESKFKRELAKTFLEYLDTLPTNKRIEQVESVLYETNNKTLPTLDRRLTPQERKCLLLASKGKEIKEMASILGLSQRTVKYHRANITKKLEVPNLMAAVALKNQGCNTDDDRFSETFLNIMGCHIYWKNKQGQYLWCNKKMAKVCGLNNEDEIIGKTDYDLYSAELAKPVVTLDKAILEKGDECQVEEIGIDSENRKAIYLSIKTSIKDEFGHVDGLIGISMDITARKRSEIAKQDFLMQMVHDLKNPLDLLNVQPQKINKSKQALLESIHDTSEKLLELINSMIK